MKKKGFKVGKRKVKSWDSGGKKTITKRGKKGVSSAGFDFIGQPFISQ